MSWWFDFRILDASYYSNEVLFRSLGKLDQYGTGNVSCLVTVQKKPKTIGSFVVSELPHCCGALFISNVLSYTKRKGNSKLIFKTIDEFVRLGRYSSAMCIIPIPEDEGADAVDDLAYWESVADLFEKNGFVKQPMGVVNQRTRNTLYTFIKEYTYD